eukprot:2660233-Pyramimonas_sp.AAC.1
MFTLSWTSLHGRGSTIQTRQIFTVVPKSWQGATTLPKVIRRLAWAMNALIVGKMPDVDFLGAPHPQAGRALASGWTIIPIFVGGDWEFYQNVCHLPGPQNVPNMCPWCLASPRQGDLCWTDTSTSAGWRTTLKKHEDHIAACEATGVPVSELFLIKSLFLEGFLSDVLHAMGEGIVPEILGNTM